MIDITLAKLKYRNPSFKVINVDGVQTRVSVIGISSSRSKKGGSSGGNKRASVNVGLAPRRRAYNTHFSR